MNEKVLNALMQLFAIISKSEDEDLENLITSSKGRKIVKQFLEQELNSELVQEYLLKFDNHLYIHNGRVNKKNGKRKRTAGNSVKLLRICSEINQELNQKQRFVVLVRIIEFINTSLEISQQEIEFLETVAESFNIAEEKYKVITKFIFSTKAIDHEKILLIRNEYNDEIKASKQFIVKNLENEIAVLYLETVKMYFLRYFGKDEFTINAQVVPNDKVHILTQGSNFKSLKSPNLYYSDVSSFFNKGTDNDAFNFKATHINHVFPNGRIGLHNVSFSESNGNLVAIMGSSGSGKTTLLNILNGSTKPTEGRVELNGINVHTQKEETVGLIGNISQDDLLFEELSVYDNLYFSAQLSFKQLSPQELHEKVIDLLQTIGLLEAKNLKVGSPLKKSISGGQRKRLNIAMELIREPAILFVDEPTSGLSSRDSERIMDLLKELALKGKLIFAVIHQPSSEIFRMFDRLLILDDGGYSIFYGDPVDAIVHFKSLTNHVNHKERECPTCGNVNPEQLFNIIEAKVVDELGNFTDQRKTSPKEWEEKFNKKRKNKQVKEKKLPPIKAKSDIPSVFKQLLVYFQRDIRTKWSNLQYVLITLLEAPVLAAIIAYFVRFYKVNASGYSFFYNQNIPQYIFIAVIISLFLGLTVAAEEIIKDKKILRREAFMNLSWGSYLCSKIIIMGIISTLQSALFVLVGNTILNIDGMFWEYFGVLFTTSFFACMLGLIISASFNSAKVIYIVIPIVIIPQLLFSGVIVKYDKLNPNFAEQKSVPWIGNFIAARWAYEALAVSQYKDNLFEREIYPLKKLESDYNWKIDFLLPEMESQLNILEKYKDASIKTEFVDEATKILINEIAKEEALFNPENFKCENCITDLEAKILQTSSTFNNIRQFINTLEAYYAKELSHTKSAIEEYKQSLTPALFDLAEKTYANEALEDLMCNKKELNQYVIAEHEIIPKHNLVYQTPDNGIFNAHFYTAYKYMFHKKYSTYQINMIVLWVMSFLFGLVLLYQLPQKLMQSINRK
ncbi:ABC-type multidrug transport system, ATPase component [Lishizhenia tianjinensis]|uniref:ABC-type multidrug transport system, ATPase component n=1 Tax=Lishizhenia tianjinensis TaxID=477690 RepID=A0A1I6Z154_9FLAO|nr:ATP-binding cassette domain-containing protein [Lishizhenia tianjinensis]SFT56465.1 ABC-type multidrug transport system, ATPase component [Lishizhenia tianjinensis]